MASVLAFSWCDYFIPAEARNLRGAYLSGKKHLQSSLRLQIGVGVWETAKHWQTLSLTPFGLTALLGLICLSFYLPHSLLSQWGKLWGQVYRLILFCYNAIPTARFKAKLTKTCQHLRQFCGWQDKTGPKLWNLTHIHLWSITNVFHLSFLVGSKNLSFIKYWG